MILRAFILPAVLTGAFCGAFALGIDFLTDMLERQQVLIVSFISGFGGSIFASLVLRKGRGDEQ